MKAREISIDVQKSCKISFKDRTVRFLYFYRLQGGGCHIQNVKYSFIYIHFVIRFQGFNVFCGAPRYGFRKISIIFSRYDI